MAYAINNLIEDALLDIERNEDDMVPLDYGQAIVVVPVSENAVINNDNPPSFDLSQFTGSYSRKGYGTMTISLKDGNLYASLPFTTFRLIHDAGDSFSSTFTEEVPTIMTSSWLRFSFVLDNGHVSGVSLNIAEGGEVFEKEVKQ